MSDQGAWFKLWVGSEEDNVLGDLSLEDWARWARFGLYTKKHGSNGIITISPPANALLHKLQLAAFHDFLELLKKLPNIDVSGETIVTVTWHNWSRFQGDFSTSRVRKHREMKRQRREERRREENTPKSPQNGAQNATPRIGNRIVAGAGKYAKYD